MVFSEGKKYIYTVLTTVLGISAQQQQNTEAAFILSAVISYNNT